MFVAGLSVARPAAADEGGVSFWLPGQQGSFAAVPGEPGWSLPIIYYHTSSDADASRAFQIGGRTALGVEAKADLFLFAPSYVFADPVAGGQAAVGLTGLFGRMKVDAGATLTGPRGTVLSGSRSDTLDGIGPTLAGRIVAYREEHGGFRSIDELKQVDGIGDKRFESLQKAVQP